MLLVATSFLLRLLVNERFWKVLRNAVDALNSQQKLIYIPYLTLKVNSYAEK